MSPDPRDARCTQDLIAALDAGAEPCYLNFWGPDPKVYGVIDESCLCNWYPAKFRLDGVTYHTTEHYLMAEKARLFDDAPIRDLVLRAVTPLEAQMLGRQVSGFREEVWVEHRFDICVTGNRAKFDQHPALRDYLAATSPCVLVEASPWDKLWGIGVAARHPRAADPRQWRGLNLLGFSLMAVRAELGM